MITFMYLLFKNGLFCWQGAPILNLQKWSIQCEILFDAEALVSLFIYLLGESLCSYSL